MPLEEPKPLSQTADAPIPAPESSIEESSSEPDVESIEETYEELTDEPVEETIEELPGESFEEPFEEPAGESPVEEQMEESAREPIMESATEPSDAPIGLSCEPPLDLPGLESLSSDLLALPDRLDYLFSAFSYLEETLPFRALALFLACADGGGEGSGPAFRLAAHAGFSPGLPPGTPFGVSGAACVPGSPVPEPDIGPIAAALGARPDSALRWAALRALGEEAPFGFWVFSFEGRPEPDEESCLALGSAMAACASRGANRLSFAPSEPEAARHLFRAIPPDRSTVAMLFDLGPLRSRVEAERPTVDPDAYCSAILRSALSLVASRGAAALVDSKRLAVVLYSTSALDPELSLYQFRKSLERSLPSLDRPLSLAGESFSLDPAEGGALEALGRFLAG